MKILQSTYVRGVAGSEKFLFNLVPELLNRNHQVEVLVLYKYISETVFFCEELKKMNVKYNLVSVNKQHLFFSLRKIAKITKKFEIINSHLLHSDLTLSLVKTFFDRKMILVSGKHGYEEWYNNQHGFDPKFKVKNKYWYTAKFAERKINASFAISKGLQNLYFGLGICINKPQLIYYGFRFQSKLESKPELIFSENQLCIVGRLTSFKGHRFAIEALPKIIEKIPNVKLVIVGHGEIEQVLRKQVDDLNLNNYVIFTGFKSNATEYMYNSKIILIPSISEGFGIVLAEAMSVKKTIIAFDVPSPSELIKNELTGILVPPYNVDLMSDAVINLLQNKEYCEDLANNAFRFLNNELNINNMVANLEQFYTNQLS